MVVAMDAMAVAIHFKYALSLNCHFTFYLRQTDVRQKHRLMPQPYEGGGIIMKYRIID